MSRSIHDRMLKIAGEKITKPTLLHKDRAGNTLWAKFIKSRGTVQIFGKNAKGKLIEDFSVAILLEEAGHNNPTNGWKVDPTSDRGRRMMNTGAMIPPVKRRNHR